MIKQIIDRHLMGRVALQRWSEYLNRVSLRAMNYGGGANVQSSGEVVAIKCLARVMERAGASSPPVVFDVGANVGEYALEVISQLGSRAQLYCFEPSDAAFVELKQNLSEYPAAKTYQLGFGERNEKVTLYADSKGSRLGSVYLRSLEHHGIEMTHLEEVLLTSLDDFCLQNNIGRIDLLKLDVEGSELSVLKGAQSLLKSDSIGLLQFEFGGCNIDSRTFFRDFFYLLNPQFVIHRLVKDGIVPISRYNEAHEVFTTTNYLAVSRTLSCDLS